MLSYWEKETLRHYDLVVLGAGIVGMSAAYHYKIANPQSSVALIDRGLFPSGASTKNAGFVCFGSLGELLQTQKEIGKDAMLSLVERRFQGGLQLRDLLGEQRIDYQPVGGYELCFRPYEIGLMEGMNDNLKNVFDGPVFSDRSAKTDGFGFSKEQVSGLVLNAYEGTIDTGKMVRAFQELCAQSGVHFMMNSKVSAIQESDHAQKIHIKSAGKEIELRAQQVAVCTNAFSGTFLPDQQVVPGRGMVLVSKPVEGFHLEGSFHYHDGYHYFRSVGNRLLLGGGRQLDLNGETTLEEGINDVIQAQLLEDMHSFIAPGRGFEMDYAWSGTMAFGGDGNPVVQRMSQRLAGAFRLGGMGVALGTQVGKELALILEG